MLRTNINEKDALTIPEWGKRIWTLILNERARSQREGGGEGLCSRKRKGKEGSGINLPTIRGGGHALK